MSYQHHQTQPPVMGATFIPGGFDDYYMPAPAPEVVSPAPQRIMPEVPENMQDNLARLELDANAGPRQPLPSPSYSNPAPQQQQQQQPPPAQYGQQNQNMGYNTQQPQGHRSQTSLSATGAPGSHSRESSMTSASSPRGPIGSQQQQPQLQQQYSNDYTKLAPTSDGPNFSPFPKIPNRPSNVPPSDDERESILENARLVVLNSNDPEMQLNWAQDALSYVDAAITHEQRMAETQPARSVTPAVEHQLRVDAMNVVSFLADQHHPKAEFLRGMWLEFGKFGLRVDKKEAFRCYTRAAEKGYSRAEYRMGMQYESTNDPVSALIHYKRGADAGDSASLYRLGMMTLLGQQGQAQDYAKGLQLIRQAAASADENAPQGAYVLGMLQARELPQINVPEIFLPYSEKEARQNIERAAYLGFAKAQVKMGAAYELCTLGCEFNPALSLHYNALAARQGEADAEMAISKWFLCGYEGVFQKNEELAYTYAQRAALQGLATAEFAMGYFNEIGMHVPVSIEKALVWYEKAAQNGNKDAQSRIEGISKQSTLSKKDHEAVAISKIKSQYGSRRGVRPDRFKSPPPPLPNIVETSPSEYSPDSTAAQSTQSLPSRLSTTTPYPLSDKPPVVPPLDRPATVAPYPLDSGPPNSRPPLAGGFFAPDLRPTSLGPAPVQRPSSAFQINPNIYANEPAGLPGGRLSGSGPSGRPDAFPPRRDSRQPQPNQQNGRFPASGPGGARPATVGPAPERHDNYPPSSQPQLGTLDIGYTAPLEIRKQQRPSGAGGPGPNVPEVGYQAPLDAKPAKPRPQGLPTSPSPAGRPSSRPNSAGRTSPNPKPPGSFPARKDSMPQSSQKPPKLPQQQQGPPPPAKPASAAAKPMAPPPGKGPKTFDAMGIPQAKQDNDCVIM